MTEQNEKQIHFFFGNYIDAVAHSYILTQHVIEAGVENIYIQLKLFYVPQIFLKRAIESLFTR